MVMHIYKAVSWSGDPRETVEMVPTWFARSEIPYTNMWADNSFWLDKVSG